MASPSESHNMLCQCWVKAERASVHCTRGLWALSPISRCDKKPRSLPLPFHVRKTDIFTSNYNKMKYMYLLTLINRTENKFTLGGIFLSFVSDGEAGDR